MSSITSEVSAFSDVSGVQKTIPDVSSLSQSDIMKGLKQFCSSKLKYQQQLAETRSKIREYDSQKRALQQQISAIMKEKNYKNVQLKSSSGELLQAYSKKQYTYELPTLQMLKEAPIDWKRVQQLDLKAVPYVFDVVQQERRIGRTVVDVKICGKRNQKKLPEIQDDERLQTAVTKMHEFCHKSKTLRAERRGIETSKSIEYQSTLEFLRKNKLQAQVFNLKSENGGPQKRLLVRRTEVGVVKSLSGKQLTSILTETFNELSSSSSSSSMNLSAAEFKERFIGRLMDRVYQHLRAKKRSRERLLYEIKD